MSAVCDAVPAQAATLRRAARLVGKTLVLRDADVADAGFVLALRSDGAKNVHLSKTSALLADQQAWLSAYATRPGEAYFIIESLAGEALGTVRLYGAREGSFCWGSWILADGAPASAAIESALMVYAYAIDHLGFDAAYFQVNVANERVWAFHERFGAVRVQADEHEFHYTLAGAAIRASMQRYRRYLPDGVTVLS